MRALVLILKAEMLLGFQLASRHRATRFVVVLSAVLIGVYSVTDVPPTVVLYRPLLLGLAGSVAAVASSRILAHGAALAAARSACCSAWVVVAGRFSGVMLIVGPAVVVMAAAATANTSQLHNSSMSILAAVLFAGVVAAATVAATPLLGASAASLVGIALAWGVMGMPDAAPESWPTHLATVLRVLMVFRPSPSPLGAMEAVVGLGLMLGFATWSVTRQRAPDA